LGKTLQKYRTLFESVSKGKIHSLYFLYGPEEYLKKEFIRLLLESALPETNRAFNLDIIYGDEFEREIFDDRVGSFPLFTDRRVVILRNFTDLSTAHKDHVIQSAGRITDSIILVVETRSDRLDTARLKNMKKTADAHGVSFNFQFLDEEETVERVKTRFKREGYDVSPDALELLVESVGTQLIDLINEVEKICLAAGQEKTVDRELVGAVVGQYRTESLFSLIDAFGEKNPGELLRKLNRLVEGGEEPVVMLGMLLKRVVLLMEVKALVDEYGRRAAKSGDLAGSMAGNINPYYAEVLRRQSLRFEHSELLTLLANLRWADYMIKTTRLEPKHVIEEALLSSHLGKTLAYTANSV
jgi:DNA polymerase-3 subunit delta